MKKVFDVTKKNELASYDMSLGYLVEDMVVIAHHEAVEARDEQSHYEVIREYPNGGQDIRKVIDVEAVEAKDAWVETEDILVFIPYTADEIARIKVSAYKALVEFKIRARYSLSDELSIHRQRDTKPSEWSAYNTYCETCKREAKEESFTK